MYILNGLFFATMRLPFLVIAHRKINVPFSSVYIVYLQKLKLNYRFIYFGGQDTFLCNRIFAVKAGYSIQIFLYLVKSG